MTSPEPEAQGPDARRVYVWALEPKCEEDCVRHLGHDGEHSQIVGDRQRRVAAILFQDRCVFCKEGKEHSPTSRCVGGWVPRYRSVGEFAIVPVRDPGVENGE